MIGYGLSSGFLKPDEDGFLNLAMRNFRNFPGFWEHIRCKYSLVDVGDTRQDEFNIFGRVSVKFNTTRSSTFQKLDSLVVGWDAGKEFWGC
jgi:hypothetical protein